jgi:hypothetical protein
MLSTAALAQHLSLQEEPHLATAQHHSVHLVQQQMQLLLMQAQPQQQTWL